jgi:predicted kinase
VFFVVNACSLVDCSHPAICVTSLNMRKWMRERMQRRKKKSPEQGSEPAPPPLQPAYFEAEQPAKAGEPPETEPAPAEEPETEADPAAPESPAAAEASQRVPTARGAQTRGGRSRRRRGGRGRGGRGREKAVAQAFAPKGVVAEASGEASQEGAAETADAVEPVAPVPQTPPTLAAVPVAPPRPPKGIVVLAIGLPGSGKSTWFKRHNVAPLSSDMMRSLLFDDVREQRFQDLVFSNLRSMLKSRLIAKRPTNYVDATNLTPQERQHWIKLAKDYGYEVHAVFFDVPLEVCIERHQRRDRVVPEEIMRRMAAKLKPPSFDEGFAKITVVRVKKKEQERAEQ